MCVEGSYGATGVSWEEDVMEGEGMNERAEEEVVMVRVR